MDFDDDASLVQELYKDGDYNGKIAKKVSRTPSFFKMFSQRGMSRIGVDDNSSEASSSVMEGSVAHEDKTASGFLRKKRKSIVDYVDPPMKHLGHPVNMEVLISRNSKAEEGVKVLMGLVNKEVDDSIKEAKEIPVSKEFDRITVTEEASARIARVRSAKDIKAQHQANMNDIQKALTFRKTSIIVMNNNYLRKQVRKIEPIYVNEARTIIEHRNEDSEDV